MCTRVNMFILQACMLCVSLSVHMHEVDAVDACVWCCCLCKLGMCVRVCLHVSPSPSFQIRGLCNGSTKVRVFQWLGCSSRLCLKVTTPHHCIISLPFHTSLSVWLIFKNETSPSPRLSVAVSFFLCESRENGGGWCAARELCECSTGRETSSFLASDGNDDKRLLPYGWLDLIWVHYDAVHVICAGVEITCHVGQCSGLNMGVYNVLVEQLGVCCPPAYVDSSLLMLLFLTSKSNFMYIYRD